MVRIRVCEGIVQEGFHVYATASRMETASFMNSFPILRGRGYSTVARNQHVMILVDAYYTDFNYYKL